MGKFYSYTYLLMLFFLAFFAQISTTQALPIIRDVFVFSECEKSASIRVRNGVAPYTYTWSFGGSVIQTDTNLGESEFSTIEQAQAGDYLLEVVDSNGNTYSETINFIGSTNFVLNILYDEDQECVGETFGIVYGDIENGIPPFTINFYDESSTLVRTNTINGRNLDLSGVPAGRYLVEVIDATGCKELTEIEIEEIEPLVLTPVDDVDTFPETCIENGGITFDAVGFEGTVQFRIRRSNGTYVTEWLDAPAGEIRYDQLTAGDYVLEVIDLYRFEDCPAEIAFSIGNEILLEVVPSATPVSCFDDSDGTITLNINRLFMAFPFPPAEVLVEIIRPDGTVAVDWESVSIGTNTGQGTFTGFGPGLHTINVRHGGEDYPACDLTYTINIGAPPAALTATVTSTPETCFEQGNGTARVATRSGGWGGYSYLWSNGQTSRTATNLTPGDYTVVVSDSEGCSITLSVTVEGPADPLAAEIEMLNGLACAGSNDGSARVFDIEGGWGNYTYLWSNGETTATAFNLPAGSNSVTIRDQEGCEIVLTVEIPVPDAPAVTSEVVNPLCFGGDDGSIRILIADDVQTFTVNANGETRTGNDVLFENLPAGQYEVTITYGGTCVITEFVDVINPPALSINENNLSITDIQCAGDGNGAINGLTASGGTGALTFQWQRNNSGTFEDLAGENSLNINNLNGGTYRLVVRDENDCEIFADYEVNEPDPLEVTPPAVVDVACFGELTGSVSFTISGGTLPYSYALNGGAFTSTSDGNITIGGLGAATGYFVEIRDANNCVVPNLNFDIASLPPINISDVEINPEVCFGQNNAGISINISGGTGSLGVQWFVAGDFSTVISTNQNLTNVVPGQYTVRVFDLGDNTCFVQETFTIPPTPALTIALDGPPLNVLCFGENTGAINILVEGGTGSYTYEWEGPSGFTADTRNINGLTAGLYRVRVTDENGCWEELTDIMVNQPPSGIEINLLNRVEPNCHDSEDGRIEIQIGGGNPGYTISWEKEISPSIFSPIPGSTQTLSNVGEGTYKVIVTDANNCVSERVIDLGAPAPLTVSLISKDDVSCFGRNDGRISINVSGGTGVYFFNWDHGFINQNPNNLSAGTYGVTVTDANGCTARLEDILIDQPDQLAINLVNISEPSCIYDDGSIEVDFVGWIPGQTTSTWIELATNTVIAENVNTVTGLAPGFYRVELSLLGTCTITQTYRVPGPNTPLQLFTSPQDATCPGENGILFLSAIGGVPGYTYSIFIGGVWQELTNAVLASLAVGAYDVRVTDAAGCEDISTISIDEPNPPVFDAEVEENVSCFGGNDGKIRFTVMGDASGITVEWFRRDGVGGKIPISESDLDALIAGVYFMEITYGSGCMVTSPDYEITQPTEVLASPVVVQPVCFDDLGIFTLTVSGGEEVKNIIITGNNGFSETLLDQENGVFEFDQLAPGDYNWVVENEGCPNITGSFTILAITIPSFDIDSQDITCFGASDGIIEILNPVVHGSRTFNVWVNGVNQGAQTVFNTVAPGTYLIRIVDSQGCESDPVQVTIQEPDRPLEIFNLSVTNVACFGGSDGSISFEIQGGRPEYRAVLTPLSGTAISLTGLDPLTPYLFEDLVEGEYTLEVFDNLDVCQTSQTIVIEEPADLNVAMTAGNIQCEGETTFIELNVTGGTQPYEFIWEEYDPDTDSWVVLAETGNRLNNVPAGQYRYTVREANSCTEISNTVTVPDGDRVEVTFVANEILCFGESALVTLSATAGSSTNFTFFVNGSQIFGSTFQAQAGSYLVYAIDNVRGCRSEDVIIDMVQPAAPLSLKEINTTDLSCFEAADGSISLALIGGTAPYTITFNGTDYTANEDELVIFNGLSADVNYAFSAVDANGCTVNIPPRTLSQPLPLQATVDFDSILCFGGTSNVRLTITGGTRPYQINWQYSADGSNYTVLPDTENQTDLIAVPAGFYRYTIVDGGCDDVVETIHITEPEVVTLMAAPEDVSCFGGNDGSVVLNAEGGQFATYRYFLNGAEVTSNTITGLTAGTYNAFVMNGTCRSETIEIVIGQPAAPLAVQVDYLEEVACHDDLSDIGLRITGGNGDYTAFLNGEPVTVDDTGEVIFEEVVPGTYDLRVVDHKGCEWTRTITILNPTPIEINLVQIIDITCFGDADGEIRVNVSGGSGSYTYRWTNSDNVQVGSSRNLVGVPSGWYTLTVRDENNCEASRTFEVMDSTPVDFSFSATDVTCFGSQDGTITVSGTGGRPDYTLVVDGIQYPSLTATNLRAKTYMVFIMDSNGCASPVQEVVINQPTPLVLAVQSTNVSCFGANNGMADATVTGGTGPYTVRWSDGNTDFNRTGLAPGNYEVVVTDGNGCVTRTNVVITQPNPLNVIDNIVPVNCFGGNNGRIDLDISGGNGNYEVVWVNNGTGEEIGTGPSISNLEAGVYRATITDSFGCESVRDFVVSQPAAPLSVQPVISNVRCFGEGNGSIDLIVSGGTAPYTYSWSSGENTRAINGKSGGTYMVNVTDANGCVVMENFEIIEPQPINVELASLRNVSCKFGSDGGIVLNITGGTGNYTVQWSNGMMGSAINGLRAGTYTVFVIDENSCFESIDYVITEPEAPLEVSATTSLELCKFDDILELTLEVTGGTAPYTYRWSNGSTTKDLIGIAPGQYTVVVTDANDCEVEDTFTVPEPSPPMEISVDGKFALCESGERGEIRASVTGGVAPYTYRWSNGATTSAISDLLPGTYNLVVTDANGCMVTEDFEIAPPLNLRISLLDLQGVSCFGGNDGAIEIGILGGRAPYNITWSHGLEGRTFAGRLLAGTYTVTVEDALGCVATAAYNVREPEILTFTETVQDSQCAGDNQGVITLNVVGGTAPYTYQWDHGPNNRILRNLAPGTYSVLITDRMGCFTRGSFTVREPDPIEIESDFSEELNCFGDENGFININVRGGIQPYRISWSDQPDLETLSRSNLRAGDYRVTVTDDNGCIMEKSFEIREPEQLEVRLFTRFDVDCESQELTGVAWVQVKGGTGPYRIFWNNSTRSVTDTEITFEEDGEITARVVDANGCEVEVAREVQMPLAFTEAQITYTVISLGEEGEILLNDPVQFFDQTLGEVEIREWDFGDGTRSNEENPIHTYKRRGTYTVTLRTIDVLGCVSEARIVVEVVSSYRIMVPNAFTPNGDGLNDKFLPVMRGIEGFEMHIFNKWGELIYSSFDNQDEGWDGTLNGRMSPNGNYVYKIVFKSNDGERGTQTGVFTLVL